jgi:hypothetical protein
MKKSAFEEWSTNLSVRTQISAFLAGTFFAVLLVFATQEDKQVLLRQADIHTMLAMLSLITTFVAFAFSTFAFGVSADWFRKGADKNVAKYEQKARDSFRVGGHFFGLGYFSMMFSLPLVLAYANSLIALFGFSAFAGSWIYLWIKTGPYERD